MINENKKKVETFESNLSCLRFDIDNLQLKHPNPMTGDDAINNNLPGYDPEIPKLSISSQISNCVNDLFQRANKAEEDNLVESLILFIIGHITTFKCTRLGNEEEVNRPVKIKFHHLLVKNKFMHHLSKLKNAPSEFKNSIKHDMMPDERSKEKELYFKAKDLNNDSSNPSKNEIYVVRGPVCDRKIVKRKKRGNQITNIENNN